MEAKGCAKPAVWKDSRRYFYWALRARLARSNALSRLANASPAAPLEYRTRLLDSLAAIEEVTDHKQVAEAIEKLDLTQTVAQLKADNVLRQLIQLTKEDRKSALDGFMRLADNFSDEDKAAMVGILQNTSRSPAPPSYVAAS